MNILYLLSIALSGMHTRRIRTVLTIGGIGLSVGIILLTIGLSSGLRALLEGELVRSHSANLVSVSSASGHKPPLDEKTLESFKGVDGAQSVESIANLSGKVVYNNLTLIVPVYAVSDGYVSQNGLKLVSGKEFEAKTYEVPKTGGAQAGQPRQVLLTEKAAQELGVADLSAVIGKPITLDLTTSRDVAPGQKEQLVTTVNQPFVVRGVLQGKDEPYAYVRADELRSGMGVTDATQATVLVSNPKEMGTLRQTIEKQGFRTSSIQDTLEQINTFFGFLRLISTVMGIVMLVISVLGAFNTITISLVEQTPQIAFMRILGTPRGVVWFLLFIQSMLYTVLGTVSGVLIGAGLGWVANAIFHRSTVELLAVPAPIFVFPWYYGVVVAVVAVAIGWLVGLGPARRATRIDPLEALS